MQGAQFKTRIHEMWLSLVLTELESTARKKLFQRGSKEEEMDLKDTQRCGAQSGSSKGRF